MVEISITKWIKKKIRRLIGIVEDGDTATHSIASGKYVVWKGDLYKASTAIAIGTTLSTSNLTAVSDGGLNEINGNLSSLASDVGVLSGLNTPNKTSIVNAINSINSVPSSATSVSCSYGTVSYKKVGHIVCVYWYVSGMGNSSWVTLTNQLPTNAHSGQFICPTTDSKNFATMYSTGKELRFYGRTSVTSATGIFCYITSD